MFDFLFLMLRKFAVVEGTREYKTKRNPKNNTDINRFNPQNNQLNQNKVIQHFFTDNTDSRPVTETLINHLENVNTTRFSPQNDPSRENEVDRLFYTVKNSINPILKDMTDIKEPENAYTKRSIGQNDQLGENYPFQKPLKNNSELKPVRERRTNMNDLNNINTNRYHPYYDKSSEKSSDTQYIINNNSTPQSTTYKDDPDFNKFSYECCFRYYQRYYNFTKRDYDRLLSQQKDQKNTFNKGSDSIHDSGDDSDSSHELNDCKSKNPQSLSQIPGIYDSSNYTSKSSTEIFRTKNDKKPTLNQNISITSSSENNLSHKNDMLLNYYKLQNDYCHDSNEKKEKKIYIELMKNDIKKELKEIWSKYIINEIEKNYPGLLEYLDFCKFIHNGWRKLNDNCQMFYDGIKNEIEMHTYVRFPDINIYRRKFLNEKSEFCENYLVVKGKPEEKFKKLYWDEDNTFIMDSKIGENVYIKGHTYIGPNCKIGDNVGIYNNCFLKSNVEIGKFTFIDRNNFIGKDCKIGVLDEKNNFLNYPNAVTEKNEILKPLTQNNPYFKTHVGEFNFIGDGIIFPNEFICGNDFIYSYE